MTTISSCSHQKPLSRDELQSKLRSAESIAAEAGTFVDFVRQHRSTEPYAKGHLEYLSSELARTAKEFEEGIPPAGEEKQWSDALRQVDALRAELNEVHTRIIHPDQLTSEQERIASIRKALQRAVSTL